MNISGTPKVAVVPVSRDPVSLEAAVSSIARAYDELSVDHVLVLYTPGSKGVAELVVEVAERLVGPGRAKRVEWDPHIEEDIVTSVSKAIDKGARELAGDGYSLALLVSPASRIQASAISLATTHRRFRGVSRVDVAHVDFYFGPWKGLVYPYIPYIIQPIRILHNESLNSPKDHSSASKMPLLKPVAGERGMTCSPEQPNLAAINTIVGSLPPLRCAVAEAARRLNIGAWKATEGDKDFSIRLNVTYSGSDVAYVEAKPSNEEDLRMLANALVNSFEKLAGLMANDVYKASTLQLLPAWAGVTPLQGYGSRLQRLWEKPVIIDTNAIYLGIHVYAWSGLEILIPECAVAEVERKYAEALKDLRPRTSRRMETNAQSLVAGLAFLAFLDLRSSGSKIIPSPPGPCDTSIPKIDPILLADSNVATSDSGAHIYWRGHPSSKLYGEPFKLYFNSKLTSGSAEVFESLRDRISYTLYALHQSIIALCLIKGLLTSDLDYRLSIVGGRGAEDVRITCSSLIKALGWGE
ncbi:MAG: hypothetical protein F7B20_02180 [Aeropyrum sp.]|nr:hypothetical protein [Aeropyrum sp.]